MAPKEAENVTAAAQDQVRAPPLRSGSACPPSHCPPAFDRAHRLPRHDYRCIKDLNMSEREVAEQKALIEKTRNDPSKDEHDVKKQEEVLRSGRATSREWIAVQVL